MDELSPSIATCSGQTPTEPKAKVRTHLEQIVEAFTPDAISD